MNEIIFFPWLNIRESISFGEFGLFPYCKNDLEETIPYEIPHEIRSILDIYMDFFYVADKKKVDYITVLSVDNKFNNKIDESLQQRLTWVIEMIAFCGLSEREPFLVPYCNKDNFQFWHFPCDNNPRGFNLVTRRRYGSLKKLIPGSDFKIQLPDHVLNETLILDANLINALISAEALLDSWNDLYQGIVNFNLANTDSLSLNEEIELVLLVSAFEQLFSCNGRGDFLSQEFMKNISPSLDLEKEKSKRFTNCQIKRKTISIRLIIHFI